MNPEKEPEFIEKQKRMAETLVRLGLASGVSFNDRPREGAIVWTVRGLVFKDELVSAYNQLAKGKGKEGMSELMTLLAWIFKHC